MKVKQKIKVEIIDLFEYGLEKKADLPKWVDELTDRITEVFSEEIEKNIQITKEKGLDVACAYLMELKKRCV